MNELDALTQSAREAFAMAATPADLESAKAQFMGKAGRITDEQFYAWSEKAREEKKKCDREIISLEEFQQWLRDSKI